MLMFRNPEGAAKPASRYSQSVEVPAGARWLYVSGQVGVRPDGTLCEGSAAQMEQAWLNLEANLAAAGMSVRDLVKINVILTRKEDVALSREVRDRHLAGAEPASTLVVVAALAGPDYLFELEGVAAKA